MDVPDDNIYNLQSELSRGVFFVGSFAAGFARASTTGISRNDYYRPQRPDGWRSQSSGGRQECLGHTAQYLMAGGSSPAILVVHEVFGVHEHIKDIWR